MTKGNPEDEGVVEAGEGDEGVSFDSGVTETDGATGGNESAETFGAPAVGCKPEVGETEGGGGVTISIGADGAVDEAFGLSPAALGATSWALTAWLRRTKVARAGSEDLFMR